MTAADAGALDPVDWEVRARCYALLIERGTAPTPDELARDLSRDTHEIETSLGRLARAHHLVLAPGSTQLWMLHPFSAHPTAYPAEVGKRRYWANCAWDSLGIPAVLNADSWTRTRCAESGAPIEYGVRGGEFTGGDEVVHFLVPPRRFYDNIAFT